VNTLAKLSLYQVALFWVLHSPLLIVHVANFILIAQEVIVVLHTKVILMMELAHSKRLHSSHLDVVNLIIIGITVNSHSFDENFVHSHDFRLIKIAFLEAKPISTLSFLSIKFQAVDKSGFTESTDCIIIFFLKRDEKVL